MNIIRVELGEERDGPSKQAGRRHGKWHWWCSDYGVEGYSRQPLLDSCRAVKGMGADPAERIGLFWPGKDQPSLSCAVGIGAGLTVDEANSDFAKWKPFTIEEQQP